MIREELIKDIQNYLNENLDDILVEYTCDMKFTRMITSDEYMCLSNSSLREIVEKDLSSTWQETLFNFIDEKALREVDVYKKAQISKQLFSKIRSDVDYHPEKDVAMQLCFGLELNIDDAIDFLAKAGYAFSTSLPRDIIIRYFIDKNRYNLTEVDEALYTFKQKLLGKY